MKVLHHGLTVGFKFVSSATAGSEGAFQRKGSHPPAPRGDESEGASDLCIGSEEAAGVILLDWISGT